MPSQQKGRTISRKTKIELECVKHWIGINPGGQGGWASDKVTYEITAIPSKNTPGISQTKRINPCELKDPPGRLLFDLALDKIAPRQRIDVSVSETDKNTSLEDTIRALKRLKDQGLLSEEEYQAKVDKAVKGSVR